jgi:iron complex outermembrane recepter protein
VWSAFHIHGQGTVTAQVAVCPCPATGAPLNLVVAPVSAIEASPAPTPNEREEGVAETERVVVTGSYIPTTATAAEVGPNPVLTINRYEIEKAGERSIEEVIRNLPVANANGVSNSGNVGAFEQGASSISLRGFDPGATLTLIDGRRVVSHPTGCACGFQFFVDLNTIPKAAVHSVEILKDGASSTYGADAVAGVVNVKLRHDYRGAEVGVEYGNSTDTDSGLFATSLVFGLGDDNTNLTGVVNYYRRNSIFSRDRAYDREQASALRSTSSSPSNLQVDRAAAEAAAGRPITEVPLFDANGNRIDTFFARAPFFSNGNAPASEYVYSQGPTSFFDQRPYTSDLPDSERYGTFLNAHRKIFADQLIAYGDVFFQRAKTHQEQAPGQTFSFEFPGFPTVAIPPRSPGAVVAGPSYEETGVAPGASNPFNPFQQILSGASETRTFEFGNVLFDTQTDAFFVTAGVKGDKLFGGAWGYDAAARYSRIQSTLRDRYPSLRRFNRVLNAADPIFNPASPEYIGTTTPYNPFGDYRVPIPNNYRLAEFVNIRSRQFDVGTLFTVDATIYTTALFTLPAGGVGLALGGQFQHETVSQGVRMNHAPRLICSAAQPSSRPKGSGTSTPATPNLACRYSEATSPLRGFMRWNSPRRLGMRNFRTLVRTSLCRRWGCAGNISTTRSRSALLPARVSSRRHSSN